MADDSLEDLQKTLEEQDKQENKEGSERPQNELGGGGSTIPQRNNDRARESSRDASGILSALKSGPSRKPSKESITFSLPADLVERLRNLCYWERVVMSKFVEAALREAVKEAEEVRNDGEPYPVREDDLPTSRPNR